MLMHLCEPEYREPIPTATRATSAMRSLSRFANTALTRVVTALCHSLFRWCDVMVALCCSGFYLKPSSPSVVLRVRDSSELRYGRGKKKADVPSFPSNFSSSLDVVWLSAFGRHPFHFQYSHVGRVGKSDVPKRLVTHRLVLCRCSARS